MNILKAIELNALNEWAVLCVHSFNKEAVVVSKERKKEEGRRKEGQDPLALIISYILLQDLELGVFCAPSCKSLCFYTGIPGCDP